MTPRLFIVDVFAERPYSGNQLAVIVSDEALPVERMQLLAAEMNYSETTFVTPTLQRNGGWMVRIFTPAREIAFAGHPILGTAWVIRRFVAAGLPEALALDFAVGRVNVTFETDAGGREVAYFVAPATKLGQIYAPEVVAETLRLDPGCIDSTMPVQQASAGVSAVIVPVRGLDALSRCSVSTQAFADLDKSGMPSLVYFHCRETRDPRNDICARFFFEANGAREDPATGNGAAFLGSYLLEHRIFPGSALSLRIEQGHHVGRPSLIFLRARDVDGRRDVSVGGSVIPTVRGELA
jgi:trans-2,3-dihydro-3-hydroxyanthranilate isomerase